MSASTDTASLVLPTPLTGADVTAYVEHGRRVVCWTVRGHGSWHRCSWAWAWFDITEREPWRGEPLWLSAQRRVRESDMRSSFTPKARDAIAAEVVPVVARYGFGRLWLEVRRGAADGGAARRQAVRAETEAQWWRMAADLADWHAGGRLAFEPVPSPRLGERALSVAVLAEHDHRRPRTCLARVFMDGEQVGWVTDSGGVVPLDTILAGLP